VYYDADGDQHGLPYSPYKSCIVPRPIGWISTRSRSGKVNLAPYSQFNTIGYDPGYLMFSAGARPDGGGRKDSVVNAEETGEFVYNMATWELRDQVNETSMISDSAVDEMAAVGLTAAACHRVNVPRVVECPVSMECKYVTTITLPGNSPESNHHMVIGRVVGVHIRDDVLKDGLLDVTRIRPLARLGYLDYTTVDSSFSLQVSDAAKAGLIRGLMGG
jgi:flavin reductase (DIM6/NTAB) family NADH-FMN oxidoreductase RutF